MKQKYWQKKTALANFCSLGAQCRQNVNCKEFEELLEFRWLLQEDARKWKRFLHFCVIHVTFLMPQHETSSRSQPHCKSCTFLRVKMNSFPQNKRPFNGLFITSKNGLTLKMCPNMWEKTGDLLFSHSFSAVRLCSILSLLEIMMLLCDRQQLSLTQTFQSVCSDEINTPLKTLWPTGKLETMNETHDSQTLLQFDLWEKTKCKYCILAGLNTLKLTRFYV